MKGIKASALLVLSCILVVISFSACSNEDIPSKAPSSGSIYPLTDVHVMASGFVSTQHNKKKTIDEARDFKAEDFIITPISEEEAKAKADIIQPCKRCKPTFGRFLRGPICQNSATV